VGFTCRTIVTKPRVLAHMIRNKFGSADNISSMRKFLFPLLVSTFTATDDDTIIREFNVD